MRTWQILCLCLALPATGWGQQSEPAAQQDSTRTPISNAHSPLDSVSAQEFFATHSFSLDHFLEYRPGVVIERSGPIGGRATFSRWGIGRGRGAVYLGGIELNDPQDGLAPLALVPTTAVGTLLQGGPPPGHLYGGRGIEGSVRLIEPMPVADNPITLFDVSKGEAPYETHRRARFSSAPGRIGGDFSYDELRSNGYDFDARGLVRGRDYGRSATRVQSGGIRGRLGGERYHMSFRDFESSFQGDANNFDAEYRRSGFIGLVESSTRRLDAGLYARSYRVEAPDSVTENTTTSLRTDVAIFEDDRARLRLHVGYDDIVSSQRIAGGAADERVQVGEAAVTGTMNLAGGRDLSFNIDAARQFDNATAWGGGAELGQRMGRHHRLAVIGRRSFRLPTLGELFLPLHTSGSTSVVGNRNLDAESSLEAGVRLYSHYRGWRNDVRVTTLRVNPILPIVVSSGTATVLSPRNVDSQGVHIIDDRFDARGSLWGFDLLMSGAATYALGDRDRYFEGVPRWRATGAASVGRDLFKRTSGIVLTGEYEYCSERTGGGQTLPSWGVFNLKLGVRLIDFRAYLLVLNVFDEQYQTMYPYLMTPTTIVYGATWLFDS